MYSCEVSYWHSYPVVYICIVSYTSPYKQHTCSNFWHLCVLICGVQSEVHVWISLLCNCEVIIVLFFKQFTVPTYSLWSINNSPWHHMTSNVCVDVKPPAYILLSDKQITLECLLTNFTSLKGSSIFFKHKDSVAYFLGVQLAPGKVHHNATRKILICIVTSWSLAVFNMKRIS